nr:hypothetical protein CFP56_32142 [Quercus suber]
MVLMTAMASDLVPVDRVQKNYVSLKSHHFIDCRDIDVNKFSKRRRLRVRVGLTTPAPPPPGPNAVAPRPPLTFSVVATYTLDCHRLLHGHPVRNPACPLGLRYPSRICCRCTTESDLRQLSDPAQPARQGGTLVPWASRAHGQ